jgi:hypothetical protein
METDKTTEGEIITETDQGEGNESEGDFVKVPKSEWEKTNQTLGSYKRQIKDLTKPKDEPRETPQQTKTDNSLLEKAFLRSANITVADEVELALSTAKKWGIPVDQLVDDEDFQAKLTKIRTQKSNELATSKIKGGASKSGAKEDSAYWKAKGTPPTPADIPDRKTRAGIIREMINSSKGGGKKYYNE